MQYNSALMDEWQRADRRNSRGAMQSLANGLGLSTDGKFIVLSERVRQAILKLKD